MANRKITDVEGIGPQYAAKLAECGLTHTDKLLEAGASAKGRKEIVEKTGLSSTLVLKWVNMCDLFRIKGIAGQGAELLKASGVDTVKELRNRNAANLALKVAEINAEKKLTKTTPSEKVLTDWIEQAKSLPPVMTY